MTCKISKFLILYIIVFNVISCKQKQKKAENIEEIKTKLQAANKQIVKSNSDAIDAYVIRHNWNVKETGTGLRFYVYKKGNGVKIASGNNVLIEYSLETLDGKIIVASNNAIKKTIIVEKENAESGIHEVLTYLNYGDKSKVILPPHLAFGLTGDEKIPPMATLVYDLKIVAN